MKILRVRLENLNSLRGKHAVDFTDPVFASGLFAITGPTGSGKSTVLDAICLALFHRTPRQDNVGQGQNGLMSTGTGSCSAEIEFSTGGKSYRAVWSQRRARESSDGALQQPRASFSNLDGTLITERVGDTRNSISEALGLSFEQFSRSVLLAQGGFDAFLKARDNERAELLERLTGTEVYAEISKAVFERARAEDEGVRQLKGQQGHIVLMEEEDLAATKETLLQAQQAHTTADKQRQDFEVALRWLNDLDRLTGALDAAVSEVEQIAQRTLAAQPDLDVLAQAERAEPFRALYDALGRTRKQHEACLEQLSRVDRERGETHELHRVATWHALASAKAVLARSQTALADHKTVADEIGGQISALGVDARLGEQLVTWRQLNKATTGCVAQWQDERGKAEAAKVAALVAEGRLGSAREAAEQKSIQRDQATVALSAAQTEVDQALAGRSRDQMVEHVHLLANRKDKLGALKPLYARAVKAADQHTHIAERLDTQKGLLPGLKQAAEQLISELDDSKELRAVLAKGLEDARHIVGLSGERDQLAPGVACPLCGSKDHPAVAEYQAIDPDRSEIQWRKQDGVVEVLSGQADQARTEHVRCQDRIAALQDELAAQADMAQTARGEWTEACAALQVEPQDEEQLLALVQNALDEYAKADQARELVGTREAVATTAKLALDASDAAHREAAVQVGLREESVRAASASLNEAIGRVEQASKRVDLATKEFQEALPGGVLPENVVDWLTEQGQAWARFNELSTKRTDHQDQLPALQYGLEDATHGAAQWLQTWERGGWDEPAAVKVPADRLASLAKDVAARAELMQRLDGQLKAGSAQADDADSASLGAQQEWAAAVEGSGFPSGEQVEAALLAPSELIRLRATRDELTRDRDHAQAIHTERANQLKAHRSDPKTDQPREAVQSELDRLVGYVAELHTQVIGHSTRLQTDSDHRQTWGVLLNQIESAQRELDDWQHLNGLIGSASGNLFRRFAQGLTLDRLIYLANKHLRNLDGGHFSISRASEDLGLMVEDAWDAGARRDANTLSGGESFLVSLALALGLSDLVSQNIQIDSFFLDEGFGTLDPEALGQAMDTIESLNASGKLIGVISHVEGVKERIPVQIRVLPTRPGSSRLELPTLAAV